MLNSLKCLIGALSLAYAGVAAATELGNDLGEKDIAGTGCWINPFYSCTVLNYDGSAQAYFGYDTICPGTGNGDLLDSYYVAVGDNNHFSPDPIDRGQPETFVAGSFDKDFAIDISSEEVIAMMSGRYQLWWKITGSQARVNLSRICRN